MRYDLVFEGGGAKGMAFVGAYEAFAGQGHTFGRLLGTSAGAITAALLAAGYTPQEMLDALAEREDGKPVFATFMGVPGSFSETEIRGGAIRRLLRDIDIKFLPDVVEDRVDDAIVELLASSPRLRHVYSLIERGGWYAADRFVSWLQAKLDSGPWKGGQRAFSDMTLAQFHAETEVELSVVAADTTGGRLLVLNHHTAPACPLVWAVRMSMSIPFVWPEVIWSVDWGAYLGRPIAGHAVVDGGVLSNFPIELLISDEVQVTRLMGPKGADPVLGMLIDEEMPVPPPPSDTRGQLLGVDVQVTELRIVKRLMNLVDTVTTAHDKMVIDAFSDLVVRLPAGGYGTTEFDMSDAKRNALVEAGRRAMVAYLGQLPPTGVVSRDLAAGPMDRARQTAGRIARGILKP
jgi:predicted acylesterase/phospholipase RssA